MKTTYPERSGLAALCAQIESWSILAGARGDPMMGHARKGMKEVLTKSFWQGVKKTFHEALEGPPRKDNSSQSPVAGNPEAPLTSDSPLSSERSGTDPNKG